MTILFFTEHPLVGIRLGLTPERWWRLLRRNKTVNRPTKDIEDEVTYSHE